MASVAGRVRTDDDGVVEWLRAGLRERAFGALLDRYEAKVYRLCCAMLRDATLAQDVAQESWVRVWRALDGYDGRASFSTWIYTIARNRCRTALERRRAQQAVIDAEATADDVAATADAPTADDRAAALRRLVDQLPERYRLALTLYYYEERSVGEVAELLALPEGTVKVTLHRARAALRGMLQHQGMNDVRQWLEELP